MISRRTQSASVVVVFMLLFSSCTSSDDSDASHLLDNASMLVNRAEVEHDQEVSRSMWRQSIDSATKAIDSGRLTEPDYARAYALRAYAEFALGSLFSAEQDYVKALEFSPDDLKVRLSYAIVLSRVGKDEESVTQLSRVIEKDPTMYEARSLRGRLLASFRRDEAAIEDISIALEVDASSPSLLELRGDLFRSNDRPQEAIGDYEAAFRILQDLRSKLPFEATMEVKNPKLSELKTKIASAYEDSGEKDRAVDAYREALKLDSGNLAAGAKLDELERRQN